MSKRLFEVGGVYVQVKRSRGFEHDTGGGDRREGMTALKSGHISYAGSHAPHRGAEVPVVVVNVVRAGPGLGGILPSQSDYPGYLRHRVRRFQ